MNCIPSHKIAKEAQVHMITSFLRRDALELSSNETRSAFVDTLDCHLIHRRACSIPTIQTLQLPNKKRNFSDTGPVLLPIPPTHKPIPTLATDAPDYRYVDNTKLANKHGDIFKKNPNIVTYPSPLVGIDNTKRAADGINAIYVATDRKRQTFAAYLTTAHIKINEQTDVPVGQTHVTHPVILHLSNDNAAHTRPSNWNEPIHISIGNKSLLFVNKTN